ncbi:MAG: hypothetical protein ACREGJ_02260 [Candidatus Saccharimonadales bacterium]
MSASEILVIILAVALAIFLVLAIVLAVYLIIIAQKIKRVAGAAERTVARAEGLISTLQKAAAPAVVSRFILDQINRFTDRRGKKKKEED